MQEAGNEYVRFVNVEKLGRDPITFTLNPTEEERADLAKRLKIVAVNSLTASGELNRLEKRSRIELTGRVEAEVVQSCVVTLEPVTQKIEENYTVCYTFNKADITLEDAEYVVSLEEADLPDLIEDGQIDVVQAVMEQVALALDPYPRAEGADSSDSAQFLSQSEGKSEADEPEKETHRPFANLKELMERK